MLYFTLNMEFYGMQEGKDADMKKAYRMILTVLALFVMAVSGINIDNSNDMLVSSADFSCVLDDSLMLEAESYEVNRRYSQIEQLNCWNGHSSARISTSLIRRSQVLSRGLARQKMSIATLDSIFKVVLFSIIMILFAAGGTGLSMPIRCLLCYIHEVDGKKRIA